jgi:hypothetical protein
MARPGPVGSSADRAGNAGAHERPDLPSTTWVTRLRNIRRERVWHKPRLKSNGYSWIFLDFLMRSVRCGGIL